MRVHSEGVQALASPNKSWYSIRTDRQGAALLKLKNKDKKYMLTIHAIQTKNQVVLPEKEFFELVHTAHKLRPVEILETVAEVIEFEDDIQAYIKGMKQNSTVDLKSSWRTDSLAERSPSAARKPDPMRHSVQIRYAADEDLSDVRPFASVSDSARFGEELRKRLWRRKTDG